MRRFMLTHGLFRPKGFRSAAWGPIWTIQHLQDTRGRVPLGDPRVQGCRGGAPKSVKLPPPEAIAGCRRQINLLSPQETLADPDMGGNTRAISIMARQERSRAGRRSAPSGDFSMHKIRTGR